MLSGFPYFHAMSGRRIITILGGDTPSAISYVASRAKRAYTTVYWWWQHDRIPSKHMPMMLRIAREDGKELTMEDAYTEETAPKKEVLFQEEEPPCPNYS